MTCDPAKGTRTSSSGCQTKHRALAAAPAPAEVGTDTSGSASPAGFRGSLLPPSPKSTPPGLAKKCLDPPLENRRQKRTHLSIDRSIDHEFLSEELHEFEYPSAMNCSE